MWQTLTSILTLAGPVLIVIYDILAGHFGGSCATITAQMQYWAKKFPELPAIMAGLFVWLWFHLFWTATLERINREIPPPPPASNGKMEG